MLGQHRFSLFCSCKFNVCLSCVTIYPKALGLGTILFFLHIKKLEVCMAGYTDVSATEKWRKKQTYGKNQRDETLKNLFFHLRWLYCMKVVFLNMTISNKNARVPVQGSILAGLITLG